MESALVLSIFLIILALLQLIKKCKFLKAANQLQPPPGPAGLPIIGNLHQFDSAKPHEYLHNLSRKYGPLMQLNLGSRTTLVISSAKAAKEALRTNDLAFSGRPLLLGQRKLSYNGRDIAFSPYDGYNKEMKKIVVTRLFSHKRVESFRPIREDEVLIAIQEITQLSLSSSGSRVINLSSMMIEFTSRFTCRVAFGKKFDERTLQEKKRFDELLKEGQALLGAVFISDYIPWLGWIDNISGMKYRLEKNFKEFDSFYQGLIDEHLDSNRPETMMGDILDTLIELKELPGFDLTWDHIKAILMDIFVAGSDTAAAAIVWTMTALVKKPSAMKRVQAEIREMVGRKDTAINEDDLHGFSYLKAVIKEAMRLYPPAPLLGPRETTKTCKLQGYDIKEKTLVFVNEWTISKDPECWENPEDFNPERFLSSNIDVKIKDCEAIPFGAGRRMCPGMSMGLATVELVLANLLYSFDWEFPIGVTSQDIDTDVFPGLTMHKKNALCLVANKYL